MKITTAQLRQIIKEEVESAMGSAMPDEPLGDPKFNENLKRANELFGILMGAIDSQFKTGNAIQKIKMILPQVIKAFQKVGMPTESMIQMVDNVLNATKRSNTGIG